MSKNKKLVDELKLSLSRAIKIGKLIFNGKHWVITITNPRGEITNFSFAPEDYWEINQIIQTYINQRR